MFAVYRMLGRGVCTAEQGGPRLGQSGQWDQRNALLRPGKKPLMPTGRACCTTVTNTITVFDAKMPAFIFKDDKKMFKILLL